MNKLVLLSMFLVLLYACKKEVVLYNAPPNEAFELPVLLTFNGNDCFYDEQQNSLTFSADEELLSDFSVSVEFMQHSTVVFDGKALKNGTVNQLGKLEYNKSYHVKIETNGVVRSLKLQFTPLPIVRIVTFDEIKNEPKSVAKMTVQFPSVDKVATVDWIGIEIRGATSQIYPKKSYGLGVYNDKSTDFPVTRSFFGLKQSHNWMLDAMYVDRSRARNKTSFDLWRMMGDETNHPGIRSQYVEVFLNHTFLGVYAFSENFGTETLGLFAESVLYKGIDNSKSTFFEELPFGTPNAARWGDWEQRFPEPSEQIVWADFQQLSELIVTGSDADFQAQIGEHLDLDNAIDYYLFINLLSGLDNIGKNWCFLKRTHQDKFLIVPWDLDATWGRLPNGNTVEPNKELMNELFKRFRQLNPDNFDQRFRQRWKQLRTYVFTEANLQSLFANNMTTLSGSTVIDDENALWQQSLDLKQEYTYIRNWINKRLQFLDEAFE